MEDNWAFIWGKKEVRAFEFVQPNVTKHDSFHRQED